MSLDLPAEDYEFRVIGYRTDEDEDCTPPSGGKWICAAFTATESTSHTGDVNRTAWILWVRGTPRAAGSSSP
jgi:hypothetical protein